MRTSTPRSLAADVTASTRRRSVAPAPAWPKATQSASSASCIIHTDRRAPSIASSNASYVAALSTSQRTVWVPERADAGAADRVAADAASSSGDTGLYVRGDDDVVRPAQLGHRGERAGDDEGR